MEEASQDKPFTPLHFNQQINLLISFRFIHFLSFYEGIHKYYNSNPSNTVIISFKFIPEQRSQQSNQSKWINEIDWMKWNQWNLFIAGGGCFVAGCGSPTAVLFSIWLFDCFSLWGLWGGHRPMLRTNERRANKSNNPSNLFLQVQLNYYFSISLRLLCGRPCGAEQTLLCCGLASFVYGLWAHSAIAKQTQQRSKGKQREWKH